MMEVYLVVDLACQQPRRGEYYKIKNKRATEDGKEQNLDHAL